MRSFGPSNIWIFERENKLGSTFFCSYLCTYLIVYKYSFNFLQSIASSDELKPMRVDEM